MRALLYLRWKIIKTKAWDFVCFDLIELKRSVLDNNSYIVYSIYVFKGVGPGTTL